MSFFHRDKYVNAHHSQQFCNRILDYPVLYTYIVLKNNTELNWLKHEKI